MPKREDLLLPNHLLRNARLGRGWSQEYVAEQLGVTSRTVMRWELGGTRPSPHFCHALSHLFGLTERDLGLGRTQTPEEFPQSEVDQTLLLSLVPASPSYIVGRDFDLDQVGRHLVCAESVAVTGLPGIGKTALALLLARDPALVAHFQHNVLWMTLGPNGNALEFVALLGKVFGFAERQIAALSEEKKWALLQAAIGDRPFLFILDDVWDARSALLLAQIAGPRSVWLYTSRFRGVAGALAGGPATYTLNELNEQQSMQLIRQVAPTAVDLEPAGFEALLRFVGGVPLALRLVGRELEQQAMTGQVRRVKTVFEELSEAREKLHAAIAVSEKALSEGTRLALYALALLPAKPEVFVEETALTIAACPLTTFDALLDLGLLESCGPGCYHMHQLIADYGRAQLAHYPEAQAAAQGRFLEYAVHLATSYREDYPTLSQYTPIILEALKTATLLEKHDELIQILLAFAPFLNEHGWMPETEQYLSWACEVARRERRQDQLLHLLLCLADFCSKRAAVQEAIKAQVEGLHLARMLHHDEITAVLLAQLGWQAYLCGNTVQAEAYVQEGALLFSQLAAPHLKSLSLLFKTQGILAWAHGDYLTSEQIALRGLQVIDHMKEHEREDLAVYACLLGWIEGQRGHYEQAEQYFQHALQAADISRPDFQPVVKALRVQVMALSHPSKELYDELAQAIQRTKEVGAFGLSVYVWKGLALFEYILGNYEKARRFVRYGVEVSQQVQTHSRLGELLTLQAQIELACGQIDQASELIVKAWPLIQASGPVEEIANTLLIWGEILLHTEQVDEATTVFAEALRLAPPEHRSLLALANYGLARAAAVHGDREEALRRGEAALSAFREMRHYRTKEIQEWLAASRYPWLHGTPFRKAPVPRAKDDNQQKLT